MTHKGWFGICPVHFGNLGTEAPAVEPRHWVFSPLLTISEGMNFLHHEIMFFFDDDHDPVSMLQVTGEIKPYEL